MCLPRGGEMAALPEEEPLAVVTTAREPLWLCPAEGEGLRMSPRGTFTFAHNACALTPPPPPPSRSVSAVHCGRLIVFCFLSEFEQKYARHTGWRARFADICTA